MTLRVAVDVRKLHPDGIGGLEGAFRGVFDPLVRRRRDAVAVTLLTSSASHAAFESWQGLVDRILLPIEAREFDWKQRLAGFDVLYCPFLFLDPEDPPIPAVVAIPDLQHQRYPEFFSPEILTLRLRGFRIAASRARRLVTLSEFSRRQMLESFHLPESRVVVTPLDCAPEFRRSRDERAIGDLAREIGVERGWLLCPANDWPHKNHRALFQALSVYRSRFGEPPPLLLSGARAGGVDLEAEARAAGVADLVRDLGWVAPERMPDLYDGASCLAFVSLFEGFGMPVVEAMRRGTPIVAANSTSLPEVCGSHALLVDPTDPEAIAAALHRVLSKADEAAERAAGARSWAERFSFERAAEQMLELLERAAREPAVALSVASSAEPPRVFVVTPSFQQARFLRATVESVLSQEYPRLDYLVADGGSTDGSVEILRSFGERVRWRSAPDGGQAAAIADAWRESGATVLAWLNSDDTYLPGAVSRAVDHLLAHPEAAMVYGNAWYIDAEGHRTGSYPTRPFDADLFRHDCFVCQPAAFVRREVFLRVGLPDPALRFCMDYDLWIRLSREFELSHLDADLACARVHEATKTLRDRPEVYREILEVTRRHFEIAPRNWLVGEILYRTRRGIDRTSNSFAAILRRRLAARRAAALEREVVSTLYSDGWSGTRSVVEVRGDADRRVRILAQSPFWPHLVPLEIAVELDGRRLLRRRIWRRGEFELDFVLPPGADGDATRVELRANRTFIPSMVGWTPDDPRPVSFRILKGAR